MERPVRDQALLKYERDTPPYSNSNCPLCGAADAEHLGNIWHNGLHTGDAWECRECSTRYCSMMLDIGEDQ